MPSRKRPAKNLVSPEPLHDAHVLLWRELNRREWVSLGLREAHKVAVEQRRLAQEFQDAVGRPMPRDNNEWRQLAREWKVPGWNGMDSHSIDEIYAWVVASARMQKSEPPEATKDENEVGPGDILEPIVLAQFPTKQRSLLECLNANGCVRIADVLKAVYQSSSLDNLEALKKLVERTVDALSKRSIKATVSKKGETYRLAPI